MIKCNNLTKEQIIELLDTYSSCQNILNKRIEYLINEICMLNEKHRNAIKKYGKENCIAYLEANDILVEMVNRHFQQAKIELGEFNTIKEKYFVSKYKIFYTSNKTAVPSEKSTLSRGVETNE